MELVPEHRALLAVDVVGAGQKYGYERNSVRHALESLLTTALRETGIEVESEPVLPPEWLGDGALLTLPSALVGRLVDAAQWLDELTARHNRQDKPELQLRAAIELGPVGERPGLYDAKITVNRMLNAREFKNEFKRRLADARESVHTGLIVSDHAYRVVFSGDYTRLVRRHEFTPLNVKEKEFAERAWIRIHGYQAPSASSPQPSEVPDEQRIVYRGEPAVNQTAHTVSGTQIGLNQGTINHGRR